MMMLLPHVRLRERGGREAHEVTYVLPRGQVCGWDLRCGGAVRVTAGRVWVTQAGDGGDYVVGAGERFVAGWRGRVVIEALSEGAAVVVD
jgi:hypothetical protein